jgi:general secretion pathway protein F
MNASRVFDYEALEARGGRRRGQIDAPDEKVARDRLLAQGVTPLKLKARARSGAAQAVSRTDLSERDVALFAGGLARLLNAGIPLVDALRANARILPARRHKALATHLVRHIEGGGQLSTGLRETGGSALQVLAALAQVGERAGALGDVLLDAELTLREQAQLRARVLSLLLYPAVVALLTLTILVIFLVVVAPALKPVFDGLENRLPLAARMLFAISDGFRLFGPWALVGLTALTVGLLASAAGRALLRDLGERLALSPLAMAAPLTAGYASYARALSLGLRRGVQLSVAHRLAADAVGLRRVREALLRNAGLLETGAQLSVALKQVRRVPPSLMQLTETGEAAGRLAPAMAEAANLLAEDARTRAERLVALAGPAITITLGGLVGVVVLTLFRALASIAEVAT